MRDELDKIQLRYERIYQDLAILAWIDETSYQDYFSVEEVIQKILSDSANDHEILWLTQETKIQIKRLRKRELEILNTLN